MVGRPQKIRKIAGAPSVEGFIPKGPRRGRQFRGRGRFRRHEEDIFLLFEEYESIRLLDYEGLNQTEASEQMNVSRPTLTRIYQRARQKVAKAFIENPNNFPIINHKDENKTNNKKYSAKTNLSELELAMILAGGKINYIKSISN